MKVAGHLSVSVLYRRTTRTILDWCGLLPAYYSQTDNTLES